MRPASCTTADGAIAIGEPEVAATWFPVNDHPRDKATYTIKHHRTDRAQPRSPTACCRASRPRPDGFTTWTWRSPSPMAPYLATMVIGNYRVKESTHDGMPVADRRRHDRSDRPSTPSWPARREVIDFLETRFGPYPFDALGGIVHRRPAGPASRWRTRPGRSTAGPSSIRATTASWVIVHELAHQWFGDSVSVNEWNEIWLNEGFATYAEWLWSEHRGHPTAQQIFDQSTATRPRRCGPVPPGGPGKERPVQSRRSTSAAR